GRPVQPDLRTNPIGHFYQTEFRRQAARGPDFAGEYTVVRWGRGANVSDFAIVSARSGAIFFDERFEGSWDLQYRMDSRLFVVRRYAPACARVEIVVDSLD